MAYVAQRLVLIAPTAVVVSSIVFIGVYQIPGDALLSVYPVLDPRIRN